MKSIILLASLTLTVSASVAFAQTAEMNELQQGKIEAAMLDQKQQVIREMTRMNKLVEQFQETVGMSTESSAGVLSALGQIQSQMLDLMKSAQSTDESETARLQSILAEARSLNNDAISIFKNN